MARVLRYPFEAITDDTDYLQVTIKDYPAPGLSPQGSGYAINEDNSPTRGNNSPAQLVEDGVILLPMPVNINDRNQVQYGPDSLDTVSAAVAGAGVDFIDAAGTSVSKLGTTVKDSKGQDKKYGASDLSTDIGKQIKGIGTDIAKTNQGTLSEIGKTITRNLAAQAASMIPSVNVTGTQLLSRQSGTVINPNMTLLMNGPALRSFSFQFKMTPRDDREAKQVKSIIRSFKRNMAPKVSQGNVFLETPNVFELRYKKGSETHPFLHRFKQCALNDITVNYTGENVYATYSDGTPISVIMSLAFTELAPIYERDYGENWDYDPNSDGVGY